MRYTKRFDKALETAEQAREKNQKRSWWEIAFTQKQRTCLGLIDGLLTFACGFWLSRLYHIMDIERIIGATVVNLFMAVAVVCLVCIQYKDNLKIFLLEREVKKLENKIKKQEQHLKSLESKITESI